MVVRDRPLPPDSDKAQQTEQEHLTPSGEPEEIVGDSPPSDRAQVVIIDMGSPLCAALGSLVRSLNIQPVTVSWRDAADAIGYHQPRAVIASGGGTLLHMPHAPRVPSEILDPGSTPLLGICTGMETSLYQLGGRIGAAGSGEHGRTKLSILKQSKLFTDIPTRSDCMMTHIDMMQSLPSGFEVLASSTITPIAAVENTSRQVWGLQFHPEAQDTVYGRQIISNFLFEIAGCEEDDPPPPLFESVVANLAREPAGKILVATGTGLGSLLALELAMRAWPDAELFPVQVDTGLLSAETFASSQASVRAISGRSPVVIDAREETLHQLSSNTPDERRAAISALLQRQLGRRAQRLGADVVVVGSDGAQRATDGSTTARGYAPTFDAALDGIPIRAPLAGLLRGDLRQLATELGFEQELVNLPPRPATGRALRIVGLPVDAHYLEVLRRCDAALHDLLARWQLDRVVDQAFCVLLGHQLPLTRGDIPDVGYVVAVRLLTPGDGIQSTLPSLPQELLSELAFSIISAAPEIGRVVLDLVGKPPAVTEWM